MEAQIVLGDRPVEVTLQRAWEALSLGEKFDLGRILLGLAFRRAGMGDGGGEGGSNPEEEVCRGAGAHGRCHVGLARHGVFVFGVDCVPGELLRWNRAGCALDAATRRAAGTERI